MSVAAAHYLWQQYREPKLAREERKQIDDILNPPEAVIARELGGAKRSMSPEEYAEIEKQVFADIERPNSSLTNRD